MRVTHVYGASNRTLRKVVVVVEWIGVARAEDIVDVGRTCRIDCEKFEFSE